MPRTKLSINDLFDISAVVSIRISPSGRYAVACVKRPNVAEQRNETSLWLWRAEDDSVSPLTYGPADASPEWLDDKTIVFMGRLRDEKKEKEQDKPFVQSRLYTIPITGGEARLRATLNGVVWGLAPSPDGRRILLTYSAHPDVSKDQKAVWEKAPRPVIPTRMPFRLDGFGLLPDLPPSVYLLEVGKGAWKAPRRLLQDGTHWYSLPSWLPDSRRFVTSREDMGLLHPKNEWFLGDVDGKTRRISGPMGYCTAYAVSPDGAWLAAAGNDDEVKGHARTAPLRLYPIEGRSAPREVAACAGKFGCSDVLSDVPAAQGDNRITWASNERIITLASYHGRTRLVQIDVTSEAANATVLAGEQGGVVYAYDAHPSATLYAWCDPRQPGELHRVGRAKPLTRMNARVAPRFTVVPERLLTNTEPGTTIEAWLYATKSQLGEKRRGSLPLVLYVHGGPSTQAGDVIFHEYTWLAENGFPVVISNPRGSTGYGDEHGAAIHGNWGDRDVHDLLKVKDAVLARYPQFDRQRVFIMGGSYGGYMTNMMLTRHPGVFRAGVTDRSICNHISFSGVSDFTRIFAKIAVGVDNIWLDPQRAWDISPLARIDKVTEPLLIIHSDFDLRCPFSQADELLSGLIATGKRLGEDVRLVLFRGESHGLSRGGRPENRRIRLEENLAWLKKHNRPRAK